MDRPDTVALFVTCLVDLYRPEVGQSTVALLRRHGLRVEFPLEQTCCGAPNFHGGQRPQAAALARRWIKIFEPYPAIVSPSPVCVAVVRQGYPDLLAGDPAWRERAMAMAARTYELSEFLVDVLGVTDLSARYAGPVAYQPACHQLRMLRTDPQARALLAEVGGAALVSLADEDACCGFGGLFSLEMAEVSVAISERKARTIEASRAALVVTSETGCLLHMAGALNRRGSPCQVAHLAELLAGMVSSVSSEPVPGKGT